MLVEFFTWWRQHLLELVPENLRPGAGPAANALVADATSHGVLTLLRRRRGLETPVAQVRLDETGLPSLRAALNGRPGGRLVNNRPGGEPVLLRIPAESLLERSVALPLAAERDLERVLGYDMERLTPFTAEEVFWGFGVQTRDRARGRLSVRLSLVPRSTVQGLIDMLAACQGRPSLIEAETEDGPRAIRLAHAPATGAMTRLTPRNAAIILASLAGLVVASPFLRQSIELGSASRELDSLAPRMSEVNALRRRIQGANTGGDAVASEAKRVGDMLEALAAVTEILPDDSYLTEFTMRERKMTLKGLSPSPPHLITLLSADPRIRNADFTDATTEAENGHNKVFAFRAELAN